MEHCEMVTWVDFVYFLLILVAYFIGRTDGHGW